MTPHSNLFAAILAQAAPIWVPILAISFLLGVLILCFVGGYLLHKKERAAENAVQIAGPLKSPTTVTQPALKAKRILVPPKTGDEYVDEVFQLDFVEKREDRLWEKLPELREILEMKECDQTAKALSLAEAVLARYSDYDILYVWLGDLRGNGSKTYLEGILKCRRKEALCFNLGMASFREGDLADAVRWWVRSCACQMGGGKVANQYPFVNLAYIAEGLGLSGQNARLLAWADAIEPNRTRFVADFANLRYRLAASQGSSSIALAITTLCSFPPYHEEVARQQPRRHTTDEWWAELEKVATKERTEKKK